MSVTACCSVYPGGVQIVERARALAGERLSLVLPVRWRHVRAVGAEAERIAAVFGEDADALVAAAWVHDIGYAPELVATGFHPLDGARFLRATGWPVRVVDLVAHHSCARVEGELRGLGVELGEFIDEASAARDALWYCDMTTGPAGERLDVADRLAEIGERYGPGHVVTRFIELARDELAGAVERTRDRLRAAGLG